MQRFNQAVIYAEQLIGRQRMAFLLGSVVGFGALLAAEAVILTVVK